ncbi:MAG: DUF4836 family protein, partial [Bacteroidetes bacterium]
MKNLTLIFVVIAGMTLSSCGKKVPVFLNSVPDDAVLVASLHPMQLHRKGQVNTLENLKEKMKDEVWSQLIEDPLSTGLMLDEYLYAFLIMEEEDPVIGVVCGMKDVNKFVTVLEKIKDDMSPEFKEMDGYTYIQPDQKGIISWNDERMIILASPHSDEFTIEYWTGALDRLYDPVKEESITSMVDFMDFHGKMKDMNLWVSSDELKPFIEKAIPDTLQFELPVELYNNYAHAYCEFADGAMYVTTETHFSEEVEKNVEQFLVLKPSMNQDLLKLAPGGNLLLAISGSLDLTKFKGLMDRFQAPGMDQMGGKLEQVTGVPPKELLQALTGDFTIAVNAVQGESMIPVEIFAGIGVNNSIIQEKLMDSLSTMAPVEKQEDFFIINFQGNEIYSGIINDLWVITNARGYKDDAKDGEVEHSLLDSKFSEYADGSLGMYLNLDLSTYPAMVQSIMSQKPQQKQWLVHLTSSFKCMGASASNYSGRFTLETNMPSENSLYT